MNLSDGAASVTHYSLRGIHKMNLHHHPYECKRSFLRVCGRGLYRLFQKSLQRTKI